MFYHFFFTWTSIQMVPDSCFMIFLYSLFLIKDFVIFATSITVIQFFIVFYFISITTIDIISNVLVTTISLFQSLLYFVIIIIIIIVIVSIFLTNSFDFIVSLFRCLSFFSFYMDIDSNGS